MPGGSTTGAPDWRDAAKLRKFLADDIPQWTPSEGAENTRAFLAALREKCSTEIGAMTGLLLALFEERVDASKAGYELAQKLKRGGGGATPREELDMEMLFGDTKDFESAASVEVKTEHVDWTPELECGVPQFQLPQRTPGQTRQARDGRRGPPGGAWAGPGAHCGVGPAWVLGLFVAQTPIRGARWSAERHSLSRPSQVAKAPYCALLSAQPRPAAGRATPWPGPPCDRPPQSASVEEVSRLA